MILIPGLASSGDVWQATVARLCGDARPQQRQCHVLSLAGFAGVAPLGDDLLAQAEAQLAAYIRDHRLGKPAIIGHSLGGFLALKLAIDHPQQAVKLIIVDALPALGAVQLPSITPEQLQGMAAQIAALAPDLLLLDVQMSGSPGFDLLGALDAAPEVIFCTAHDQYALQAFEASALGYLQKPVQAQRLATAQFLRANRRQIVNLAHVTEVSANAADGLELLLADGTRVAVSRRRAQQSRAATSL